MTISDWPIARKLTAAFGLVILAFAAVIVLVFSNLSDIGAAVAQRDAAIETRKRLHLAASDMLDLSSQLRGFLLTRDAEFPAAVAADHAALAGGLDALRAGALTPGQARRAEEMAGIAAGFMSEVVEPELTYGRDPATLDKAMEIVRSGLDKEKTAAFKAAMRAFEDDEAATLAEAVARRDAAIAGSRAALLGGAAFALAAAAAAGWLLTRQIAAPVARLTEALRRLAGGDASIEVPGAGRADEVGAMAAAVQVLKTAAIEQSRVEAQAAADRTAAEQERARGDAERHAVAQRTQVVVDGLAAALGRLSAGDLTCALTEPFAPEYERLRADFNAAVDELRRTIAAVVVNMAGISAGTGEISLAADDLSRRTEQQAASLEETAASVAEITGTVRKTAEGADAAQGVVAAARVDAEHGETVVRDAVAAMGAIETSAREIGQIIGVIDEIAFQTNLLALNAGVEAARAGDSGRGFAVVASEVRVLAQRSADAAKEIKALIGASTAHVARGVTLVRETGAALGRIVGQVTQIDAVVTGIAASARDQASGLAQVNEAVGQMDQVTQQNAAMVEQSTAASRSLAQDAAELAKLTGRFRTGADQAAAPPRRPAAPRAPAKALRVVGGKSARPSAAEDQAWAEF